MMNRREALGALAGAAALALTPRRSRAADPLQRPNVLWISAEDISPDLGCYGDPYATTPSIDAFAAEGVRYERCFCPMGVCAPARSSVITGCYPSWLGTNHMRCQAVPPDPVRCFPEYLRAAGYYCTNNAKTDYQFGTPLTAWDQSNGQAHWRGRAEGQPFFSVFNLGVTHESQARSEARRKDAEQLPPELRHDPAKAVLPPYYPDTPVVRQNWAQYYDNLSLLDGQVAKLLEQLADDGLASTTIVWFWGDHGRGLPRGKRWLYDSGLRAPLLIRVPEALRETASPGAHDRVAAGYVELDLVDFLDFAPTMLSLCGIELPKHFHGQAFLGIQRAKPRVYVHGARDRVDETSDTIRAVRNQRFKYVRNYQPQLPRSLTIAYLESMPIMQEMRRLNAAGELKTVAERQYFEPTKPLEELYDTVTDPHEVNNLAADPKYRAQLERLRAECLRWQYEVGDFGLLPESEYDALKRPDDQFETTSQPVFRLVDGKVALSCPTPGASLAYRLEGGPGKPVAEGRFLWVGQAKMHGQGASRRGNQVTAWRDRGTWFEWTTELPAGKHTVHVLQAYARGDAPRKYTIEVGDQRLDCTVVKTKGWDDFQSIEVGEVELTKGGKVSISIKPEPGDTPYSMDLQAIVIDGRHLEHAEFGSPWRLYTQPLTAVKKQQLTVKACRLGFRDSAPVVWNVGQPLPATESVRARPNWRGVVDRSGVVERILGLRALDRQGDRATAAYLAALTGPTRDDSGAVRYWAVVGLHTGGFSRPFPSQPDRPDLLATLLTDDSPAVRCATAHALCDAGQVEQAAPVLLSLLVHPLASAKLLAATAIRDVGEPLKPYLPRITALLNSGNADLKKMSQHVARSVGGE